MTTACKVGGGNSSGRNRPRGRLYQLLYQKWVEHQRRALAAKRGGGKVRQASQPGNPDDSSPLEVAEHRLGGVERSLLANVHEDVAMMLNSFEPESERRQILSWLLEGWTQQQIGEKLGLSRDRVGRRVRSIYQTLQQKFANTDNDLESEEGCGKGNFKKAAQYFAKESR